MTADEAYAIFMGQIPADIAGRLADLEEAVAEARSIADLAANGSPIKVSTASAMTDQDKMYLYLGSETGYNSGHIYYYLGGVLTDGGVYGGVNIDATLAQSGQAADAKAVGDAIIHTDANGRFYVRTEE